MTRFDQAVPFVANPDATHCYQASLRMVLRYFRPRLDRSWAALDAITGKVDGFGTWPFAGLTWLQEQGLHVTNVELMDNARFAAEGRAYIGELVSPEFAESLDRGLDLSAVQAQAAVFAATVRCEVRMPTLDDVRRALETGALAICNVNSRALNGREGYSGHFVVATGFDANALIVHDPGPPGEANRRVSFEAFEKAWAYPTSVAKTLVLIRDTASRWAAV
jgi:hypothetical protein